MKYETLSSKIFLKEVGDLNNIIPYSHKNNSFITNEGWKVNVSLTEIDEDDLKFMELDEYPKKTYNVSYTINGDQSQYKKSDVKSLFKIIKTVVEILQDIINKDNTIKGLTFFPRNENRDRILTVMDLQKGKSYQSIYQTQIITYIFDICKINIYNTILQDKQWEQKHLELDGDYTGILLYRK